MPRKLVSRSQADHRDGTPDSFFESGVPSETSEKVTIFSPLTMKLAKFFFPSLHWDAPKNLDSHKCFTDTQEPGRLRSKADIFLALVL